MSMGSVDNFLKRICYINFRDSMKREHSFVNQTSLENESQPEKKVRKQHRQAIIGNIGFDIFSVSYIDGYNVKRKFMVVNNTASEVDSYNFWSSIWEEDSRVIVRFDKSKSKRLHWLNKIQDDDYTVGEFIICKKIITDKYYTQLELTVRNTTERKSRKLTHYQYHGYPGRNEPDSSQLMSFLKMVNKKQDSYCTRSDSRRSTLGPIVIHSIDCFEKAVSICTLDICLDQLMKVKSVSVPHALLQIRSQMPFESISLEEYTLINKTLLQSICALNSVEETDENPESVSFRIQVKKLCLALNEFFIFKIFSNRFKVGVIGD